VVLRGLRGGRGLRGARGQGSDGGGTVVGMKGGCGCREGIEVKLEVVVEVVVVVVERGGMVGGDKVGGE